MKTGEIVKRLRIERGITQEELAKRVGYSHKSSINKIEQGKADISQHKIVALADALGVTPDVLFFGDQNNTEEALFDMSKDLTDDERADVIAYIQFLKSKRK